jgi:hypothetical protein
MMFNRCIQTQSSLVVIGMLAFILATTGSMSAMDASVYFDSEGIAALCDAAANGDTAAIKNAL